MQVQSTLVRHFHPHRWPRSRRLRHPQQREEIQRPLQAYSYQGPHAAASCTCMQLLRNTHSTIETFFILFFLNHFHFILALAHIVSVNRHAVQRKPRRRLILRLQLRARGQMPSRRRELSNAGGGVMIRGSGWGGEAVRVSVRLLLQRAALTRRSAWPHRPPRPTPRPKVSLLPQAMRRRLCCSLPA